MSNTYNAEGKRVAKTVGGTTARFFYEYDNVAFEYTNSGTISAFNVIGTGLISRKTGTDKVYYFYNGHADVTALLDATTKNIRSQYKYDEFGNISSEIYYDSNGVVTTDEAEIIRSQILYAGYQYDEESKYYNLHARYYDPQTARFLQQDTYMGAISDPLSLNLYAYCHNEPMMYFDPSGHDAVWIRDMATKYHFGLDWEEKSKSAILTSPTGFKFVFTTTIIDGKMYIDEDHFLYATGLKAPSNFNDVIAATRKTQAITKSSVAKNQTNDTNVNKGTGKTLVTAAQLKEFGWSDTSDAFVKKLNDALVRYGITDKDSIALFMATMAEESGWGKYTIEQGSDSYFAGKKYGKNGRGAGYIQITWRDTHLKFLKSMGDNFSGADTAQYIADHYPMEAAAWFWSNEAKTGEGNLNAYVNKNGSNLGIFLITQYFVNGLVTDKNGNVPAAFMSDLAAIRQGGTFNINGTSLSVNGNTWRLPVNWSSRKDAYDKAIKAFK
ncbi:MAG: tRNA nuclease WapA precursor [Firmicutes bacterium ADurb.Bin419]|nr:MAG: tRNA nuclease WapA precursor [Firmicutes bacterium ADurb.Bin419]